MRSAAYCPPLRSLLEYRSKDRELHAAKHPASVLALLEREIMVRCDMRLSRSGGKNFLDAIDTVGYNTVRCLGARHHAIGITTQRQTTLLWERTSEQPVYTAIARQCRRSRPQCERLIERRLASGVRAHSGVAIDAYVSATSCNGCSNMFLGCDSVRRRASCALARGTAGLSTR
jgi:FGGY family of carbohydrate kinases, N-terminal domain